MNHTAVWGKVSKASLSTVTHAPIPALSLQCSTTFNRKLHPNCTVRSGKSSPVAPEDRGRDGAHNRALEGPRVEVDGSVGTSIVSAHALMKVQGERVKSMCNAQKYDINKSYLGIIIALIYLISLP
jgi:hypothetical protein